MRLFPDPKTESRRTGCNKSTSKRRDPAIASPFYTPSRTIDDAVLLKCSQLQAIRIVFSAPPGRSCLVRYLASVLECLLPTFRATIPSVVPSSGAIRLLSMSCVGFVGTKSTAMIVRGLPGWKTEGGEVLRFTSLSAEAGQSLISIISRCRSWRSFEPCLLQPGLGISS